MTAFLTVFFMSMPGPFFPAVNTEVLLLYQVVKQGQDPVWMVLAAASGHMTLYVVLHALGEQALMRWKFMAARLQKVTAEQRARFKQGATAGLVAGALTGVPPMVVMAPLSSSIGYPRGYLALISFLGRAIRFGLLVAFGAEIKAWLGV